MTKYLLSAVAVFFALGLMASSSSLNLNTQAQWITTCDGGGIGDGGFTLSDAGYFCDAGIIDAGLFNDGGPSYGDAGGGQYMADGGPACYGLEYDAGTYLLYDAGGTYACYQPFTPMDGGVATTPVSIANTNGVAFTAVVVTDAGQVGTGILQLQTSVDGANFTVASVNGTAIPNVAIVQGANATGVYGFDVPQLSSQMARVFFYPDGGGFTPVMTSRWYGKSAP